MMVDSIASARFKILRPKPVGLISDGDVRSDSVTVTKNNTTKRSGDIITVSGKGRLKVEEVDETKTGKCTEELNTISMIYKIKIGRFKLSVKKLAYCPYRTIIRYGTMVRLKFKCATTGFLRKQPCQQRVNLFHEGVFTVPHFQYAHSDEKQITDIHFEGTTLRIGIKPFKNDSDVDQFVNFAYQNKWEVNLYVEHSGYDALDIRDQGETMADDEGNESSDAYCSSDEEDLSYVDFHTEVDDNVVIKTMTTNDPFLNKLCYDSGQFINFIDEPVNANVETVVEDTENIDHEFNVKNDWRKVLVYCGRDVKAGRCAGMIVLKKEKKQLGDDESLKVNKVTTRSRSKTDEGTSKSPKTPVKAITSGEGCSESPKWTKAKIKGDRVTPVCGFRLFFSDLHMDSTPLCQTTNCRPFSSLLEDENWRMWEYRKAILDSNPRSTCRLDDEETSSSNYYFRRIYVAMGKDATMGESSAATGESSATMGGQGNDCMSESGRAGGRSQRGSERDQRGRGRGQRGRGRGQMLRDEEEESFDHEPYNMNLITVDANVQTQESIAANMSDRGEIGFRLGDFEAEDNHKSNAELEIPSAEPIAAITPSADKEKQLAEPSKQPNLEPQAKKKGSKRKTPSSNEEVPLRIIFHKNRGKSESIFNQKIKKFGFGPDGEGKTPEKAFSLM
ncbi:hypothetical protein Tco_1354796 [Tanacetum coccineum]